MFEWIGRNRSGKSGKIVFSIKASKDQKNFWISKKKEYVVKYPPNNIPTLDTVCQIDSNNIFEK